MGAVVTTLLLTFVLMRVLENQESRAAESSAMGAPPQEELQFAQADPPVPPDMEVRDWMVWVVTGAGGLAIAGLGLFLLNRANWGRSDTSELIRREAGEAIEALDSGHDVGDTIERCYLNMVRSLEETRRVRRSQSMTPREFEQRLSELGMHSKAGASAFGPVRAGSFRGPAGQCPRSAGGVRLPAANQGFPAVAGRGVPGTRIRPDRRSRCLTSKSAGL